MVTPAPVEGLRCPDNGTPQNVQVAVESKNHHVKLKTEMPEETLNYIFDKEELEAIKEHITDKGELE